MSNEKKKIGRPKSLPTMDQVFDELGVEVKPCEACGAKPATFRHYANGRTLCRKCSRPYFKKHLNKIIGAGAIILGVVLYHFL